MLLVKRNVCRLLEKLAFGRLILTQAIMLIAIMITDLVIVLISFTFFHDITESAIDAIFLLTGAGLVLSSIVLLLALILDLEEVCGNGRDQK